MEAKEEIRSRLNIEDVVGEYVQLKRAGRNFKGLSPFSNEKTPSFMVSPDKHIWHDFSSNKGGDVFSFVMEVEGVDFRGALEILARKAGVDLSQFETKGDRGLGQKKERLYKLLELAVRFYQQSMVNNQVALEYVFRRRGLSKRVVQQFGIGYAPNADDALLRFLLKRGYKEADVKEAGLLAMRRGRPGDMFRGRMMVPLADGQGRTVGFTARLLEDVKGAPKYINTPQTLLYDKGRQVFGLHLAKEAIRQHDYVVLVEGNLDVVASHQAGVAQVVATAGTAMTESHLRALSRLTNNIRLAFDRDAAGVAATERAIGIASKLGLQLHIVSVPDGYKDPDELIQADAEKWQEVCDAPKDAIEWLVSVYANRFDLKTAEGKRKITTEALDIIRQLNDAVEQEHYLRYLSKTLDIGINALVAKLRTGKEIDKKPLKVSKAARVNGPDVHAYQDTMLALGLYHHQLRDVFKDMQQEDFTGLMRQKVFQLIQELSFHPWQDDLLEKLQSDELRVKIKELWLILESKELYANLNDSLYSEMTDYKKLIHAENLRRQEQELFEALKQTEDEKEKQKLNQQRRAVLKEIDTLKR